MKPFFKRRSRAQMEIAPDEIFLDASNLSSFDSAQMEGRLEKPISSHTFVGLFFAVGVLVLVLLVRAGYLELVQGTAFAAESAHNSLSASVIFAPRGVITDRYGTVLAENVERPNSAVQRYYTIPSMGSIIGYVSSPKKDASGKYYDTAESGMAGLEAQYNTLLTGTNGTLLTETNALGQVQSQGEIVPPKEGKTLKLTIDAGLQSDFANAIAQVANARHFLAGAGVILDVHTGAVRAIVSYPSYDPNVMVTGGPANVITGYSTDPRHPFLDHAAQGVYTPGSIVKPFIAAGALTDGIITPNTIIDDTARLTVPDPYHPGKNFVYTGWKALGLVNVVKAIAWSSDVFFYTVGGGYGNQKGLGIDRLDYWYHQFGFGQKTNVDLPREAAGVVPSPAWKEQVFHQPWYLGDTYFTSIGQYGMKVTPLQMARGIAAVANGGKLYTPFLRMGTTPTYSTVPVKQSDLSIVRYAMRQGVTTALAHAVNLPYVSVAAKTGTAQVGAQNKYDNAWVEGFFPYNNPQYSFAVVLEQGPSGAGEQAVNVMHDLFVALHAAQSPYVGGSATTTPVTLQPAPAAP